MKLLCDCAGLCTYPEIGQANPANDITQFTYGLQFTCTLIHPMFHVHSLNCIPHLHMQVLFDYY